MLCLYNANASVNIGRPEHLRKRWLLWSPFAKKWGGPCERPEEFWTNEEARWAVRNKIRYAVARWGAFPSLAIWEFWNEVWVDERNVKRVASWHEEMARYLRSLDPYGRPITTSGFGGRLSDVFSLPEVNLVQAHVYWLNDFGALAEFCAERAGRFEKPFLVGEFGARPLVKPKRWKERLKGRGFDPEGVHLHNGLWGALAGGSCGGAVGWFWKYVDRNGLYRHFEAAARFVKETGLGSEEGRPLKVGRPRWREAPEGGRPWTLAICAETLERVRERTFVLPTSGEWRRRKVAKIRVWPDGRVEPLWEVGKFLFGLRAHPDLRNPPVFIVKSKKPWTFVVHVRKVVGNGPNPLRVWVDGKLARERDFPAGPRAGRERTYIERYDNWICFYDEEVEVDVSAGEHEVKVEELGKDRMKVWFEFRDYLDPVEFVPLRVAGVSFGEKLFVWAQNLHSNWLFTLEGKEIPTLAPAVCQVLGIGDGAYRLRWFDPWRGEWVSETTARAMGGKLSLPIPSLKHDLACWAERAP